jgi:hypothetical protein
LPFFGNTFPFSFHGTFYGDFVIALPKRPQTPERRFYGRNLPLSKEMAENLQSFGSG